jgi:thiamine biosynthesis protein ThiI
VSQTITQGNPDVVLVRYGELGLKGLNRHQFEKALVSNIRVALRDISKAKVERQRGRIAVFPERRGEAVARRLQDVFGITSVSPAWGVEAEPEAIARAARPLVEDALASLPGGPDGQVTFRVRTSRADKNFPLRSTDLDRFVADRVLPGLDRVKVQLDRPMLELGIEVRPEGAFLFAAKLPGHGGLPVGTLGRAVCLISGGIDSPVAAWMAMKRGCEVVYITFHSHPYIGEPSKKKVVDLVRELARFQPRSRLYIAPFTETQEAIRDHCREGYRTVLYRRMMQRIASRIAEREGAGALITGESMGQVASQTLENLTCIEAAADLPVLRPLIAFDKQEAVDLAKKIGTFDLSCVQEPDCCTIFMPRRPIIRGKLETCVDTERELDVEGLVQRAIEGVEVVDVEW